jgi:hypothetical protein
MLMQAFRVAAQHNLQIRHFPPFHGGNTGSIPVGRANEIKHLASDTLDRSKIENNNCAASLPEPGPQAFGVKGGGGPTVNCGKRAGTVFRAEREALRRRRRSLGRRASRTRT